MLVKEEDGWDGGDEKRGTNVLSAEEINVAREKC